MLTVLALLLNYVGIIFFFVLSYSTSANEKEVEVSFFPFKLKKSVSDSLVYHQFILLYKLWVCLVSGWLGSN